MREPERWRRELAVKVKVPFWTVDSDVVVPSKLMPEYLTPFESPRAERAWKRLAGFRADSVHEDMTRGWKDFDRSVQPVAEWKGGTHAGLVRLRLFTETMLPQYEVQRNKPEADGTSALSPYLHYGHMGPQTIALSVEDAVVRNPALRSARDSYFKELIAWRELMVNFVRYQPNYDTVDCAEAWAKRTISKHAHDEREHLYTLEQMEAAGTYDELWNAAQIQMVRHGWMLTTCGCTGERRSWSGRRMRRRRSVLYLSE